jgi:hypothetical protein
MCDLLVFKLLRVWSLFMEILPLALASDRWQWRIHRIQTFLLEKPAGYGPEQRTVKCRMPRRHHT